MRIGFDGACLTNRRGFGRFARQILAALGRVASPHELIVLLDEPTSRDPLAAVPARFERRIVPARHAAAQAATSGGNRRLGDLLALGRAASRERLDVLYFPASYSYFPVWNVPRVVVTIFDALPLTHPALVFPTTRGRLLWTLKERAAVASADRILTTSEASRRDLIRHYGLADARIGRISAAPDPGFGPRPHDTESDAVLSRLKLRPDDLFFLYVGGLSPHKNVPRLVEAFARAAPEPWRLVIVGDPSDVFHTDVPAIRAAVTRAGIGQRVDFAGFVPDADLAHLYSRAYALVQPSLLEGFGLPPVEAMACGTPVLYSNTGSLPEVVDDAGFSFDPTDLHSIAAAIARLIADPCLRDRLATRALERASKMTWDAAARQLIDVLESVAAAPRGRGRIIRSA